MNKSNFSGVSGKWCREVKESAIAITKEQSNLQVGRNVCPLITHLPEFLCLEVIYNYAFWVF